MNPLLNLAGVDATQLMDYLYNIFCRDFVSNRTHLNGTIWIDPRSHRKDDGKEASFWHLTTRTQKYQKKEGPRYVMVTDRLPDFRRSERLEWVRLIIQGHNDPRVRCFYHQETNEKRDIRLYMWAYEHDFVVILQKLGRTSSFLVTSFYVDHDRKRADYERRYEAYVNGALPELEGCEWF
ncbi:RlfB protein [Burkholderia stagnalis]|uniref:RlfB protein n=1 Tax=Burkholderia stagnalis TaxID=1503054 RepID=UPI000841E40C|nr:RlfB protein [Burkholderia stagnalis]AOK53438.1 RlfB protein [Burkholderia stagnalis]